MSILARQHSILDTEIDGVTVLYGKPGSGKTALALTFPKTAERPLLYVDVMENGGASARLEDMANVNRVQIEDFRELQEVMAELTQGYFYGVDGVAYEARYSTIVIDSITQMEYLLKEQLKTDSGKSTMNIGLWGLNKDSQEMFFNLARKLHTATGALIVLIAHEKDMLDENKPHFGKTVPNIMTAAAFSLCAKASYVWYTNVESAQELKPDGTLGYRPAFMTYIGTSPTLLTKCRKPPTFEIPEKVENMTYKMFEDAVLNPIRQLREDAKHR